MSYECRIETDSITKYGERLTTFVCTFPRFILAEVNTHGMLSKSSASSRAIPVRKQIDKVMDDPFMPIYWGKNQKGMQAEEELDQASKDRANFLWKDLRNHAVNTAVGLMDIGVHKQISNRVMEPWFWHTAIITGTEWQNFFNLRDNKMAQPEFKEIAAWMRRLYNDSTPRLLSEDKWHLPFTTEEDREYVRIDGFSLDDISVGRCARVSYETHDGKRDPKADAELAASLLSNGHMAPFEHVARPMTKNEREFFRGNRMEWTNPGWESVGTTRFCGKLDGWIPKRKMIRGEENILGAKR